MSIRSVKNFKHDNSSPDGAIKDRALLTLKLETLREQKTRLEANIPAIEREYMEAEASILHPAHQSYHSREYFVEQIKLYNQAIKLIRLECENAKAFVRRELIDLQAEIDQALDMYNALKP